MSRKPPRRGRGGLAPVLLAALLAPGLAGCVAAVGAGAAAGTVAAVDRRTAGTLLDDEVIEWKALQALSQEESLWSRSHIEVTSVNGVVLLTGETPDPAFKERIEAVVSGIPKVRRVVDEIAIAAPSSLLSRSSDALITGRVKAALLAGKALEAERIKVVTERGVVYLMGLVTREEADQATAVARRVGGVQKVVRVFEYL